MTSNMMALIPLFQDEMKQKGFASRHLQFYSDFWDFPHIITNEPEEQSVIKRYFQENEIDPRKLTYDNVVEIATEYVHVNVPPQLTGEEDGGCWYDETYDLWISNIAYYVTYSCFKTYMHDNKHLVDR